MDTLSKMNEYRKSNKYCDVIITVGSEYFGAHKAVLAASSEFFEKRLDDNSTSLDVSTVDASTFAFVLDFMYTAKADINSENIELLRSAAKTFLLPKLSKLCQNYDVSNSCSFENSHTDATAENNTDKNGDLSPVRDSESNAIKRSLPVSIFPLSKRTERKAKHEAYATIHQSFEYLESGDEGLGKGRTNKKDDFDDWVPDEDDPSQRLKKRVVSSRPAGPGLLVCETCQASFSQTFAYQLHLLCHDDVPAYKCDICGVTEATNAKMKEHMENFHFKNNSAIENGESVSVESAEGSPPTCDICNRSFSNTHNLSIHMKTHEKPMKVPKPVKEARNHVCSTCSKAFKNKSHLRRHMITHTGERKHCCTSCGKLFLKSDHLKRHERTHTSERPFTCEDCGKTFRDKDHLKRHRLSHTTERPYFCEICAKQFKDKSTLSSHLKSHSATALSCNVCAKTFKTADRLKIHIAKHSEEKPHICQVCNKKFPFKGRLRKHMLTHTGERPYHCETCGKQFRDNHSLRLHQKIHTGIGLFPCSECGKQFTNHFHLKRHERIHTGEKPFRCDECKRTFSRMDNLEAHKRLCSGKSNYLDTSAGTALISEAFSGQKDLDKTDKKHADFQAEPDSPSDIIIAQHDVLTPPDQSMRSDDGQPPTLINHPHFQARLLTEPLKLLDDSERSILSSASCGILPVDLGRNSKYFSSPLQQTFAEPASVSSATSPHLMSMPQSHVFERHVEDQSPPMQSQQQISQILNFDVNAAVNSFITYGQQH